MATLIPVIRASLHARMERLLTQPLVARIDARANSGLQGGGAPGLPVDSLMNMLGELYASRESRSSSPWQEDATDGTVTVRLQVDYDRAWSGDQGARAVLEAIKGAMDSPITCLSDYQLALLQRSPREFLASTNREAIDLVGYETDRVGRYPRVIALRLAKMPTGVGAYTHLAVVPNLVQLERQLAALDVLDANGHEELGPLRALVGAVPADSLVAGDVAALAEADTASGSRLDEHQRDCVAKVLASPHFTVVEGPPGSGKTTVIVNIIQRALSRGWRVLVASSTHVAVDNIVEKLTQTTREDDLAPSSTPVRFASRLKAVAPAAAAYWVGSKQQHRVATVAHRVEQLLSSKLQGARQLFQRIDPDAVGSPPLTSALVAHKPVLCGTPIGILSCDAVSQAVPGSFDLLVVDEVSKMTVPEFLAVAVKAKRWCLVGDPAQMPPFCDAVDVATTLGEVLPDEVELVCSVAAGVERMKPRQRSTFDLVVVATDPLIVARAVSDHAVAVNLESMPTVHAYFQAPSRAAGGGILVCAPEELPKILDLASTSSGTLRRERKVLLQRGVTLPSGVNASLVKDGERAGAMLVDTAYYTYHALPWARARNHKLPLLGLRNGLPLCQRERDTHPLQV